MSLMNKESGTHDLIHHDSLQANARNGPTAGQNLAVSATGGVASVEGQTLAIHLQLTLRLAPYRSAAKRECLLPNSRGMKPSPNEGIMQTQHN